MKILVVSGFWPIRSNPISGVFVVQQVQAYLAAGCDVTVIAPQSFRGTRNGRDYHQKIEHADVFSPIVLDVPQSIVSGHRAAAFNSRAYARATRSVLNRHCISTQFDGVHVHDIRYCGLSYPDWRNEIRCPALLTLHGVDPFVIERSGARWLQQRLARVWNEVARVVLVGKPLRRYADVLGVPIEKRSVIHNGSELPEQWNAEQRTMAESRVVLSVSNLVELKGIDLNLKALASIWRRNPKLDWKYRIVGDGPEMGALRRLASDLGIDDRVQLLGRLGRSSTLAEIARCDIFSLPSWGENFGIVYLEAMGRGRPVIGCRDWGAAEMVIDGRQGLLVEPKDVHSLAAALEALLKDPERCQIIGHRAREQAEKFSWTRNVQSHLELFDGAA